MKILIYAGFTGEFSKNMEKSVVWGSELSALTLAEELMKRGYQITFLGMTQPHSFHSIQFDDIKNIEKYQDAFDLLIVVRFLEPFFKLFIKTPVIFWQTDRSACHFQSSFTNSFPNHAIQIYHNLLKTNLISKHVCVSHWQKNYAIDEFNLGEYSNKMCVIPNMVRYDRNYSIKRNRRRIVHLSDPSRSFQEVCLIFNKIKKQIPDAELHFYFGLGYFNDKMKSMASLVNAKIHDKIENREVFDILSESSILLYPLKEGYHETFCNVALEAMTCGCVPVSTNKTGIAETIREGGVLLNPINKESVESYVNASIQLLTDDVYFNRKSRDAINRSHHFRKETTMKLWEQLLLSHATREQK